MNNTYGTRKPANITSDDVEIFYSYRPSQGADSVEFTNFKKLDSDLLLETKVTNDNGEGVILPGMFDLRLPLDVFGAVGIYTIYIKPKEIHTQILDVSTLAAYPDIRGIVIPINSDITEDIVGYRVEYFNESGRTDEYRIITSANKCEPIAQNLNDATQKGVRYRFNENSNLLFCTLTPSTALSFKATSLPNIGMPMQNIALINTKFNPVMLEIEMVEHDIETITTMLEGDQIRDLDNATITTYNKDKEIYHQAEYYTLKNKLGEPLYEVKVQKEPNNSEMQYDNIVTE